MVSTQRQQLENELLNMRGEVERLENALREAVEAEQHEAIDHLDEYFLAVESKFSGLRTFLSEIFTERS